MEIDLKRQEEKKEEAAEDDEEEEEEEEDEEEIETDFSLLKIDNARIIEEMMSMKKQYEIIVRNIYTMICIVVMLIAICNLGKYQLLFGIIFMIAFTSLHFKNYGLSLIYHALNIPHDKKQP